MKSLVKRVIQLIRESNAPRKSESEINSELFRRRGGTLGKNCFIGDGTVLDSSCSWLITIGDEVTLSRDIIVLAHDASTKRHIDYTRIKKVVIGNKVFVGAGTIILPGVKIGDNAVIGAGSVVTKDIPDNSIAVGNPARVICTLDEYLERKRKEMGNAMIFSDEYWKAGVNVTPEMMKKMVREMGDGIGYMK